MVLAVVVVVVVAVVVVAVLFQASDECPNSPHLEHVDSPSPEYVPLRHAVQM